MRIIFRILCVIILVSCSPPKDKNRFNRIETGDYPFLPIGTTIDSLKLNYGIKMDSIVYEKPPKQTLKASRVLFDKIISGLYIWIYAGEVIYYVERFDCKDITVSGLDSVLTRGLYNVNIIDSLWRKGGNTWILMKAGDDKYFTHFEYPNVELGCKECGCRVSGGYHSSLTEGLIESF